MKKFSKKETKDDFYPMFLDLIKKDCKIEAFLLMLSTWNFACFRYAWKSFDLSRFTKAIKDAETLLKKTQRKNLKTIDFDNYSKETKKAFTILANIKGVQKTGAPKLMHLLSPKVFVMWDAYIRKHYGFKKGDADDYFAFLKLMQRRFPNVKSFSSRTGAKLIDEHNYITITLPALRKNKLKKENN